METADMAITITIAVENIRAVTPASPMTNAPTMLTAAPIARGIRTPASRTISNTPSMRRASTNVGKGKPSLALAIESRSGVGIISG